MRLAYSYRLFQTKGPLRVHFAMLMHPTTLKGNINRGAGGMSANPPKNAAASSWLRCPRDRSEDTNPKRQRGPQPCNPVIPCDSLLGHAIISDISPSPASWQTTRLVKT